MAAGKPIIAAVRGDAANLVHTTKSGIVCEPGNPDSIVEAIEKLMSVNEDSRKEMEKNALKAINNFNINGIIKKYENLFLKMTK